MKRILFINAIDPSSDKVKRPSLGICITTLSAVIFAP
jgi:hypothetical protein